MEETVVAENAIGTEFGAVAMFVQADPVVKGVMILLAVASVILSGCSDSRAAYYRSHRMPTVGQLDYRTEHHELPPTPPALEHRPMSGRVGPRVPTQSMRGAVEVAPDQLHLYGY